MSRSQKGFNDSDMFAFGIGIVLTVIGIFISFDPFKVSELILLCLGIFALMLGISSTLTDRLRRNTLMLSSFIIPVIIFFALKNFSVSLSNLNNGISLFALSFTIIMLPFSRTRQEKEQEEVDKLKQELLDKNEQISNNENNTMDQLNAIREEHSIEIQRVIKDKEERVKEIQDDKNAQIKALKSSLDMQKKDFESKNNDLLKKSRNEILTMNQQNKSELTLLTNEIDLLKDKVRLLDKTNKELKIEKNKLIKEKAINTKKVPIIFTEDDDGNIEYSSSNPSIKKSSSMELLNRARESQKISDESKASVNLFNQAKEVTNLLDQAKEELRLRNIEKKSSDLFSQAKEVTNLLDQAKEELRLRNMEKKPSDLLNQPKEVKDSPMVKYLTRKDLKSRDNWEY